MTATRRPGPIALARAALRLRSWARPLLLSDGRAAAPPTVPAAAWSLFLTVECCALPLHRRLAGESAARSLGAAASAVLGARRLAEQARVDSARVLAGRAARAAAACAGAVAVLGSGVLAFDDATAVDVEALGVLVRQADAGRLADALHAHATTPDADATGLAPLDVRTTLLGGTPASGPALWTAAAPHAEAPGLHRLGAADQLGDLLAAGARSEQAGGRGTLRQLLVIQHAARLLPRDARADVITAMTATDRELGAALLRAAAVDAPPPRADAFAESAAAAYILASVRAGRGSATLGDEALSVLHALLRVDASPRGAAPASRVARVARGVGRLPAAAALAFAARLLARPYALPFA